MNTTLTGVSVDRRTLIRALEKVSRVIPGNSTKPVLQCVRLECGEDQLWLAGTDMETSLLLHIEADGGLPRCVVNCPDLLKRVKAGKTRSCDLAIEDDVLIVNGGSIEHRLPTLPPEQYPLIPTRPEGQIVVVPAQQFRSSSAITLTAVAKETSRYAINGVLLEVQNGVRLVATDGRRLVVVDLDQAEVVDGEFAVILPPRLCRLIHKLVERGEEADLQIRVKPNVAEKDERVPADVYIVGPGWLLHSTEVDGRFPQWRDVVPQGGSRFMLERDDLLRTVQEVSLACSSSNKGVRLLIGSEMTCVSAWSGDGGESSGQVTSKYLGGGDSLIITGLDPAYLIDCLQSLPSGRVLIELHQNKPNTKNGVCHLPPVIHGFPDRRTRWVIMPLDTGVEANPDSLGSNYVESRCA